MKNFNRSSTRLFSVMMVITSLSCGFKYQIYDLNLTAEVGGGSELVFRHDSFQISYDFQAEGGVMLFNIYNQSNSDFYMRMDSSMCIMNQEVFPYFDPYRYPPSVPDSALGLSYSTNQYFDPIVKIPPQKDKWVEGFPVNLEWQKVMSKTHTDRYSEGNTPIYLINVLKFSFKEPYNELEKIEHGFWLKATHEATKSRFERWSSLTQSKVDKFYLRANSAQRRPDIRQETVLTILEDWLYTL